MAFCYLSFLNTMFFTINVSNWIVNSIKLKEYISTLKDWEYTLEIKKLTRSQQQNKLYWSILEQINKERWISKDDAHIMFKDMFLKRPIITAFWSYYTIPSTSEIDKEEFTRYIDSIILFCQEEWLNILN